VRWKEIQEGVHQGRDEGGHNSPGAESLRGAPKSPNNVASTFFNSTFASEKPQVRTWGRQSNLVTPLLHHSNARHKRRNQASFKSVVLKLGSARRFSGDREAPSKKINTTLLKKKNLCKIKFSGNLFFQTKLNKHNLELW